MDRFRPDTSISYTFPTVMDSLLVAAPPGGRGLCCPEVVEALPGLLAQAERLEQGLVPRRFLRLQVVQQAPPLSDQLEQPPPRAEVLRVRLQVVGDHVDPLREERDLDLRGPGVRVVHAELADDVALFLSDQTHDLLPFSFPCVENIADSLRISFIPYPIPYVNQMPRRIFQSPEESLPTIASGSRSGVTSNARSPGGAVARSDSHGPERRPVRTEETDAAGTTQCGIRPSASTIGRSREAASKRSPRSRNSSSVTACSTRNAFPLPRKGVGAHASHLDRGVRRRDLVEGPHEGRQRLRHRRLRRRGPGALLHGLPRRVAGVRGDAERESRLVLLVLFREVAGDLRGGADAHRQDAGGHRVECAGVAALPLLEDPSHGLDRLERGDPPGLVEDEHSRGHDITAASASSIFLFTSGSVPGTVHPAALWCPPPPKRAATAETSTRPFDRKLTRKTSSPSSRKETATSTPTIERG